MARGGAQYASSVIARNALWNFVGLGLPLLFALVCIPPLIADLGTSRFGLLALLWAIVSYFGVFDLGLGRALTQRLSVAIGAGRDDEIAPIAVAGLIGVAGLGIVAAVVMAVFAPWGLTRLNIDSDPHEAAAAARAIAWALPWVLLGTGLRGVLEACGAFVPINVVRVATGTAVFVAPLLVVRCGWDDLEAVAWALVVVRAVGCVAYLATVARLVPGALSPRFAERVRLADLLRTGGWMSLTNVFSPLLTYLDRFIIGAALSTTAIAWYVTPQEIVSRLLIVPAALTGVLFPRLSQLHGSSAEPMAGWRLERVSIGVLFLLMLPITLVLAAFAPWVLDRWVGSQFAQQGAAAMAILCGGVLVNALAQVPFAALQARDGARKTALLQLVELPPFVLVAWLMTGWWGVTGTAFAWTLRVTIDFAALRWMTRPEVRHAGLLNGDAAAAGVGALVFAAFASIVWATSPWGVASGLALGALAWCCAVLRLRGEWPLALASWRTLRLPR